jgi:hypothetical protein
VGILSPLYRFSARLSAYYQARADALRLHQIAYQKTNIVHILDAFTPQFDFAKEPEPDKLMQLAKLFSKGESGESK